MAKTAIGLKIEMVDPSKLCLDPANTRKHSPRNLDTIQQSLREFGQQKPIVVDGDGMVVAGNGTLEAARSLGWKQIAIVRTKLKGNKARAYAIADNRTAELASWDDVALSAMLTNLQADPDIDALLTGFDAKEIQELLLGQKEIVEDEPPPPPVIPITKPGDLWILGEHRVLCGDSTKPEDVERLMAGEKAKMLWSDPPYGVDYVGGFGHQFSPEQRRKMGGLEVENDNLGEDGIRELLSGSLGLARDNCELGSAWYVAAPAGPLHNVFGEILGALGIWKRSLVWLKSSFVMGRGDYHYRHEPIFYGWTPGAGHWFKDSHSEDSIFEYDRPVKSENHPTVKPVGLVVECIENSSQVDWLIYDPFLGSGTTLIAAEQLKRRCYGMEIEPKYCDIIVKRWESLTGKKAKLEGGSTPTVALKAKTKV